jgi:hypothetical protein
MHMGNWYKCKGCGKRIGFFPEGLPPYQPPGSVGHEKPHSKLGVPGSVLCALYNRLSAEELTELHRDAEPVKPPDDMTPYIN